jgi:phosphatidylinositol glycan class T
VKDRDNLTPRSNTISRALPAPPSTASMKLQTLLQLPSALSLALFALSRASAVPDQEYSEHLYLKPLPNHHLHADFNFTATTPLAAYDSQHFRYFPRSLAQILQYTHTTELHLRFGLGRWDEEQWGPRPQRGRREGGTGVELWAWIEGDVQQADERWSDLVNSLSGLFCASLNFVDSTKTIRPVMSFEPEGTHTSGTEGLQLLHGMLPHEVVCTENLTPFLKLLPCKGKAGISSLLDGHKLFDASWQSMAIDVRPVCPSFDSKKEDCSLEIQQTVSMALSIPRSMRDRHNPIPRPPRVEDIECDESKPWNGRDTCYPKPVNDDLNWSLAEVFGRPIRGACPIGDATDSWDVSLDIPADREIDIPGGASSRVQPDGMRQFSLEPAKNFDLLLPRHRTQSPATSEHPPLYVSRQMTGHGQERGGMHATLKNPHAYPQTIVYLETLPWFLKPYIHTLEISRGTIEKMYYTPALDRKRGTHLELVVKVPALTTVELNYDFEKAILRYTEYPPDANRGFDVAPAVIRVLASNASSVAQSLEDEYLRTTSLLLPLPTPDFSMPYNVIILTSTVIALGFGSIFNMLVRRFVLLEEVPASPLKAKVAALKEKLAALLGKRKAGNADPPKLVESAAYAQSGGKKDTEAESESIDEGPRLRHVKSGVA